MESSYLIASISNYYSKFAEKETNKKYYFLDTGLLGLFLQDQDSKLLENQVYIHLRRNGLQPYFLKRNTEVDFFVPEINMLIQVSYSIEDEDTYQREVKGLAIAMNKFSVVKAWIITRNEERTIKIDSGVIHVIPAWQWLLMNW